MTARRLPFALALLLLLVPAALGAEPLPDTILYSPDELAQIKRRVLERDPALMPAFRALIRDADRASIAPAEAVVLKPAPPPGGSLHDYWSLDPDWWPDPKRPHGLPWIRRDGRRNPEADGEKYDRQRLRRMSRDALTLAQAWRLTGDEQYAGKGSALIWSWCCDSLTRTNPRLDFARTRPGGADGTPTGVIETRDLIRVAEAARLLEPSRAWNPTETRRLTEWFRAYLRWLLESDMGRREAAMTNYHGVWYDAQTAVFALYVGNRNLARSIVATLDRRRVPPRIRPEDLKKPRPRRDAFFTLEAFFVLAAVGERLGVDLWNRRAPDGGSIREAFDRAAPGIVPAASRPDDATGRFDPFRFTPLFHRAALVYKDKRYLEMLKALPPEGLRTDRALLFH